MVSIGRIGLLALLLATHGVSAEAAAEQCAQVSCDCDAFAGQAWRSDCLAQEQKVRSECDASGGKLQSYCGLHGPSAFPVALSTHFSLASLEADDSSKALLKQVEAQDWSTAESKKTFRAAVEGRQYGPAIQLASLLDKDSEKLFALQIRTVVTLIDEGKVQEARVLGSRYAEVNASSAEAFAQYSGRLWQNMADADSVKEQRAYRILSFKSARTAATIFEYSGMLYAEAEAAEQAAKMWQRSASLSQTLIGWESLTDSNPKHLRYYQAQASARWHRATFHWLQANRMEQVAQTQALAESARNGGVDVQNADSLHGVDKGDIRAIKRK